MYSMPQHAVTKGYWKIEYFRAQPMASSRRLVMNPASPDISLPIQGAVIPGVEEPHHENAQEDDHLCQTREAERTVRDGPGVQENELDVEHDEENGNQVELDRDAADRSGERGLSALERLGFHGRWLLWPEHGCQPDAQRCKRARQDKHDNNPDVFSHAITGEPSRRRRSRETALRAL